MKNINDNFTLYLRKSLDLLFILHPERTSLGILFGYVLDIILNILKTYVWNNLIEINIVKLSITLIAFAPVIML